MALNFPSSPTLGQTYSSVGKNWKWDGNSWQSDYESLIWGPTRSITIGNSSKNIDGSANVSWSLADIGVPSVTGVGSSGTWGISITGSAATLTTGRTIGMTGDVTWTSASFNGSANVTGTATLANSGVTAGTYTKVTVDAKGRVTTGSSLTASDIPELTMSNLPGATYKQSVKCATTANITLSGTQTIDGISVVAGDRVLVKNQTTASQNGIYIVASGTWTRAADADTSQELGAGIVAVDSGTTNGGELWTTTFRTTDTLGTTAMNWYEVLYNTGTWGISITGSAATLTTGRTIGMTGDVTWTSASFNGSANVTGTATLANSGVTAGTYGSASAVPVITVDAKGRITSASTTTVTATDSTKLPLAGGTMTGNLSIISGTLERTITLGSSEAYLYGNATTYGVFKSGGGNLSFNVTSGDLTASGNVTAYSDIRLKTDLEVISDAISKVKELTGYTYTRIDTGSRQTGLVAQDVKKVLPEAVEDSGSHLSLAYGNLVGLLVEAIKEQQAQIDKLTSLVMKG